MTVRSCSGKVSSARWTRHAFHDASASSSGVGAVETASGGSATVSGGAPAQRVDDRVPRDRVQPGPAGPPSAVVARGGAPHRGEDLLHRVLGATAVADASKREPEDRPRVPA